jgi:hypothetical protein
LAQVAEANLVKCVIFAGSMNRVLWFIICVVVGLELIAWGLLVPVHLRAVDGQVLEVTGSQGPSLQSEGLTLVNLEKPGPARLLLAAVKQTGAPGRKTLEAAIGQFEESQPKLNVWGGTAPYLERVFEQRPPQVQDQSRSIIDVLLSEESRETAIAALRQSPRPAVLEILRTRQLTNTVIFPPASSSSGQPLDATIVLAGLLHQQDHFTGGLRQAIEAKVLQANRGGDVVALENIYLDLLGLGKRLNWAQLVHLLGHVPDADALRTTARLWREREASLPVIYAAVHLVESPTAVAEYLDRFPETGFKDMTFALGLGGNAVRHIVEKQKPVHYPTFRDKLVRLGPVRAAFNPLAQLAADRPVLGFMTKLGLCLLGGLLVGRAITYLSPTLVEEIVRTRPLLTGPQIAIALCLVAVVFFFTESFVRQVTPKPDLPFQINFPVATAGVHATLPHQTVSMSDKFSVGALLMFFVIQAIIYVFCRMKLAEIRGQPMPSKLKMKLLENEEHLFDAGLYFGFLGTVLSLILFFLGVFGPSLMAAYSSTSFGIIFVSVLKIFHLRPYRRQLIMEVEAAENQMQREPQMA